MAEKEADVMALLEKEGKEFDKVRSLSSLKVLCVSDMLSRTQRSSAY